MAPDISGRTIGELFEDDTLPESHPIKITKEKSKYNREIIWKNVVILLYLHLGALYGIYLAFTSAKLATLVFAFIVHYISGFGTIAGAHRLWSHRSYKAKWPIQLILMIFSTIALQDNVISWSRNHRSHHKYSDSNADPHNPKRGFFFSHIGWLLCKKHPDVVEKGKGIDMSDLTSNPILAFQKKYYWILAPLMCFVIPTVIPVVCWDETWKNAFFIPGVLRYVYVLNATLMINSINHNFGNKPYDKDMFGGDNIGVSILTIGEGWHNYHHVFPWDYKVAELKNYKINNATALIDFFAKMGWAYDLKTVPQDMVRKRVERTGDGSHELWGWGDKDQTQEERDQAIIKYNNTKNQ